MANLNILFIAALLILTASALDYDGIVVPPEPSLDPATEPPAKAPAAEGPSEFNYYASRDKCLKMLGNLQCAEQVAYIVVPESELPFVPSSPSKWCCRNVMNIDGIAPECWNQLIAPEYMFLKGDLLQYCNDLL